MEPYLEDIQTIALKVMQFKIENAVYMPGLLQEASLVIAEQSDLLVLELSAKFLGEDIPSQIIKVPANWWEHFKERFFPASMKEIWPVEYTCYLISFQAVYPNFKPALPKERLHVGHTIRIKGSKKTPWYIFPHEKP